MDGNGYPMDTVKDAGCRDTFLSGGEYIPLIRGFIAQLASSPVCKRLRLQLIPANVHSMQCAQCAG